MDVNVNETIMSLISPAANEHQTNIVLSLPPRIHLEVTITACNGYANNSLKFSISELKVGMCIVFVYITVTDTQGNYSAFSVRHIQY